MIQVALALLLLFQLLQAIQRVAALKGCSLLAFKAGQVLLYSEAKKALLLMVAEQALRACQKQIAMQVYLQKVARKAHLAVQTLIIKQVYLLQLSKHQPSWVLQLKASIIAKAFRAQA